MEPNTPSQPLMVEYRPVPGFPGYRVGDDGSIWTCRKTGYGFGRFGDWRRMQPSILTTGRLLVCLHGGSCGKPKPMTVQQVVMLVFVGEYPPNMEICHNDGDCRNNNLSNLRYDTRKSNHADKLKHGTMLRGDRHPIAKLNEFLVRQIKLELRQPDYRGRLAAMARKYNIDEAVIARIRDGKAWKWVAVETQCISNS